MSDRSAIEWTEATWNPVTGFIAKPGREEQRPLSIPTVCDRIVQTAPKTVIEPIFEAGMLG